LRQGDLPFVEFGDAAVEDTGQIGYPSASAYDMANLAMGQ
jgi:hypothetical protein